MSWISDCALNLERWRIVVQNPNVSMSWISDCALNRVYLKTCLVCHVKFLCPEYRTALWTNSTQDMQETKSFYVLNFGLRFEPYPFFGLSQQRFWAIKLLTPRYCQDLIPELGTSNLKALVNAGVDGKCVPKGFTLVYLWRGTKNQCYKIQKSLLSSMTRRPRILMGEWSSPCSVVDNV